MQECVINFYSGGSVTDRNIPPNVVIRAVFHLYPDELSRLFPVSLRQAFSKLSKQTVSHDISDYSGARGVGEYIETYSMKLYDVLEACRDVPERVTDDRKVVFYMHKDAVRMLKRDTSPLMRDDDRTAVGDESRVLQERDLWVDVSQEHSRPLSYYYDVESLKRRSQSIAVVHRKAEKREKSESGRDLTSLLNMWGATRKDEIKDELEGASSGEGGKGGPALSTRKPLSPQPCGQDTADAQEEAFPLSFHVISDVYMPDVRLKVGLQAVRSVVDANGYPYTLYVLVITQGDVQWRIEKRYSQFSALHDALVQQGKAMMRGESRASDAIDASLLPHLPGKHSLESAINVKHVEEKRKASLVEYLSHLLRLTERKPNYDLMCFLGAVGPSKVRNGGNPLSRGLRSDSFTRDDNDHYGKKGEKQPISLHVNHLMAEAEIGDIVLFQSKNHLSSLQRQATGSRWDHVGLVVRMPIPKRAKHRILMKEKFKRMQALSGESSSSSDSDCEEGQDEGKEKVKEKEREKEKDEDKDKSRHRVVSLSDPSDVDYLPVRFYVERDLCLLEATGDGVTILPLAQRLQSYHTYDICHCMAVRKLRPLEPLESSPEKDTESTAPAATHASASGSGMGAIRSAEVVEDGVDGAIHSAQQVKEEENTAPGVSSAVGDVHTRAERTTIALRDALSEREMSLHLESLNSFLLGVENLPYGLSVGDLVGQKKKLHITGRAGAAVTYDEDDGGVGNDDSSISRGSNGNSNSVVGDITKGRNSTSTLRLDKSRISEDKESEDSALLQRLAAHSPRTAMSTLGDFCERDDDGWAVYEGRQSVQYPGGSSLDQARIQEGGRRRAQERGQVPTPSAADLFPGLEQRTFFCSALVAAGLKALGVLSPALNDNYFWPGAFSEDGDIDEEARHMQYCFTREVLVDLDTLAVAKLTHVGENEDGDSGEAWDKAGREEFAEPGKLFSLTVTRN